ncbi:sigma-70 family RNA polymerase sigma factor [Paenibacillus tarimensis]
MKSIRKPRAYLCKITVNRCLDLLRSSRKRREAYVGPWLPEPLLTGNAASVGGMDRTAALREEDPETALLHKDQLSFAFLLLLESLSGRERAVFVLREALGTGYEAIADMIGSSPVSCRQLYSRAKRKLNAASRFKGNLETVNPPVPAAGREVYARTVERFAQALAHGRAEELLQLLTSDVVTLSYGGGKVFAALHPITGIERVSAFLLGIASRRTADTAVHPAEINGLPGFIVLIGDHPSSVLCFDFDPSGTHIRQVFITRNPEKLGNIRIQNK